jgi:hypothetical protein
MEQEGPMERNKPSGLLWWLGIVAVVGTFIIYPALPHGVRMRVKAVNMGSGGRPIRCEGSLRRQAMFEKIAWKALLA